MYAELYKDLIGKTGPIHRQEIREEEVRRFAEAFGDPDPIYTDREYAKTTPYGGIIAPPTYAFTLPFPDVPGFSWPFNGLIHGQEDFEYHKPLLAGRTYLCQQRLADVFEKSGKHGIMVFFINEYSVYDENMELCIRMNGTIIGRGVMFEGFRLQPAAAEQVRTVTAPAAMLRLEDLKDGQELPDVVLPAYDRVNIARYAGASGDFNRIHLDDESARKVGFAGTIAHGMLTVALETTVLKKWFGGETACRLVQLSVKFASPANVGDIPTVKGKIVALDPAARTARLELAVVGTASPIITGTATVSFQ